MTWGSLAWALVSVRRPLSWLVYPPQVSNLTSFISLIILSWEWSSPDNLPNLQPKNKLSLSIFPLSFLWVRMIVLISMAKFLPEFPYCSNTVWNLEEMFFKSCFSNICLKFNILFCFIFGHAACEILFPGSGIESGCSAVKAWRSPNLLDGTVGWHHGSMDMSLSKLLKVGDGQGSLPCCSPWSHSQTWMRDWTELNILDLQELP